MPRLTSAVAIFLGFGAVSFAQLPCGCPESATAREYTNSGGDSKLLWKFETFREPSTICYKKQVDTRRDFIADVNWPVAAFKRQSVSTDAPGLSCVHYPGESKAGVERGPLWYGVSSQTDTEVKPPDSGWLIRKVQAGPEREAQSATEVGPPLRSEFVFGTKTNDGRIATSHVTIESNASYDGKFGFLSFRVVNDGNASLKVLLNIPATPEIYGQVPAAVEPYLLRPKDERLWKAVITGRPGFAPSTVVFYTEAGQEAALETAGFYAPTTGKPNKSDELLWQRSIR